MTDLAITDIVNPPPPPTARPKRNRGRRTLHFVRHRPLLALGLFIMLLTFFLAAFGPMIAPYSPTAADGSAILTPPSGKHWLGTDSSGSDIFSRVIAAPRIDVTIALIATVISLVIGSLIGLFASYYEGWIGSLVMRTADVIQAFPLFVLAMILVTTSGSSLTALVFAIAFLNIPIFIRLMRSQVLSIKGRSFVEAARAAGHREFKIAVRHVLPNSLEPGLIQASVTIGFAIILTAGLSFVGAGVRPPTPEWGSMISSGANTIILGQWWPSVFPGIAMSLAVLGFAIVGEALQDALGRNA
jgi:peptide/nickel transport system permease protein